MTKNIALSRVEADTTRSDLFRLRYIFCFGEWPFIRSFAERFGLGLKLRSGDTVEVVNRPVCIKVRDEADVRGYRMDQCGWMHIGHVQQSNPDIDRAMDACHLRYKYLGKYLE